MQSSWFCNSLCFFLFLCAFSSCFSSTVPESSPNVTAEELYSKLSFFTYYYIGGESLIGKLPQDKRYYSFMKKYVRLQIQDHRNTNDTGVYKVRGYLLIQFPYWYGGDHDRDGSRGTPSQAEGTLRIWLSGLWSENTGQLLMLGSRSWVVDGKPVILDAGLDLNYTAKNDLTLYTGYISGSFKSLVAAIDPGYFDPFSIFSFPTLPNYNYSLLSEIRSTFPIGVYVPQKQLPSDDGSKDCWAITGESILMDVEYAADCNEKHQNCSPFDNGSLPRLLLLTPIQCSASERKMRYMATFQNTRYDQGFGLKSTVIGEALWDDNKKVLFGIACRLFDPLNRSADEIWDCTMRLSMWYTSIFTIRNEPKLVGRFRSTRHADKSGYFRKMNLTKSNGYDLLTLPEVRYEYTRLDEVRRSCAMKKPLKRENTYPHVHSDNMRCDLSVQNSKGQDFAWISASPLWIGNDSYQKKNISESMISITSNISYMISMSSSSELEFSDIFNSLNWSTNANYEVEITAEGVYNAETGSLCMVGCRKLEPYGKSSSNIDCEILVQLEFPPSNGKRGGHTKGTITSMRARTDPLHFNDMFVSSTVYYVEEAAHVMIWRMDMEIAMVLISNTLVCIFVALQINHVRRYSKVQSSISLVMLLILSVGNMIPLILNLEERQSIYEEKVIYYDERLQVNELTVRLSSLIALLLQIRLLQLVWTAKQRDQVGERKASYVLLLLYFIGGSASSVIARRAWGGLRSYAGLIMDCFLLPQVLLNAFRGSAEKALSGPFYGGISAVRVAPHAYNLYRAYYYPASDLKETYYYANPDVGFYSRAWDIVVPFGIIMLVVITFLQQRRRGSGLAL